MRQKLIGSALEALGVSVLPGLALGFLLLVASDALSAAPTVQESIASTPLWAAGFLLVVAAIPVGILAFIASASKGRSEIELDAITSGGKGGWPE